MKGCTPHLHGNLPKLAIEGCANMATLRKYLYRCINCLYNTCESTKTMSWYLLISCHKTNCFREKASSEAGKFMGVLKPRIASIRLMSKSGKANKLTKLNWAWDRQKAAEVSDTLHFEFLKWDLKKHVVPTLNQMSCGTKNPKSWFAFDHMFDPCSRPALLSWCWCRLAQTLQPLSNGATFSRSQLWASRRSSIRKASNQPESGSNDQLPTGV